MTIASGATVNLLGQALGAEPFNISGTGLGGVGALYNGSTTPAAIAGAVNFSAASSFSVGGIGDILISAPIGSNNTNSVLTKVGNNTLTLAGSGDNWGLALIVNGGTVVLAKSIVGTHAIGSPGAVVNSGGTLQLGGGGFDEIFDTAPVTVNPGGTFDTNGGGQSFGTLTLSGTGVNGAGALLNSSIFSSTINPTSTVLAGNTTIDVANVGSNNAGTLTLDNTVSGAFSITKIGAGSLILNGNNTFTGGVILTFGTLVVNNPGALNSSGTNALSFTSGGAILNLNGNNITVSSLTGPAGFLQNVNPGSALLTINNASNNTYNGVLRDGNAVGSLAVTKIGAGTLTLGGVNTFSGNFVISGGTVFITNPNATGNNNTIVLNSAGTLDLNGQSVSTSNLNGEAGTLINSSTTPAGFAGSMTNGVLNIAGAGDINLSGSYSGSIINANSSANLTLSGSNDNAFLEVNAISGSVLLAKDSTPGVHAIGGSGLNISGGLVQLAGTGGDQLADNANVAITSGSFDANGMDETVNGFSFEGTGLNNAGAILNSAPASSTLTAIAGFSLAGNASIGVTQIDGLLTINSPISGGFGFNKVGQGTLSLTAVNTFTGTLTVSAGTLSLDGGSLSSNLTNNATFTYNAGTFGGRLTNAGNVEFNADFSAANGIENDSALFIPPGRIVSAAGAGLNNTGTLGVSGTLALSTLNTVTNTNQGTLALSGGVVNGFTFFNGIFFINSGFLTNSAAGLITGFGTINAPLTNVGTISPAGGTLNVPAFINTGDIEMASTTAPLSGGTITNNATIEGFGKINNPVTNNATIEATQGNLVFTGNVTNSLNGTIAAATGNKVLMQGANFPTNAGLISLAGGTFDNGGQTLDNTGQISGFGVLATGGLTNDGILTLTRGTTTVNGPVTNSLNQTINVKFQPAVFTGNVTNNGTIKTTNTTVTFTANYTGNTFISDPATNIFQANATTLPGGLITGSSGDAFLFNTFTNNGTFQNGGYLSVSTAITNTATFSQSGPQSWSPGATFTNSSGTAAFQSNAKLYGLTITAGTVDITTSKFIIEATTSKSATLTALQQNIATHSLIASGMPANFALALLDNAITHFTSFGGQPVDNNALLLSIELLGDANADGHVDLTDLSTVLNNFGSTSSFWTSGNFDNAPTIDLTDLSDVLNNFGQTNPNANTKDLALSTKDFTPTPDPTTLALLTLSAPFLLSRRKRLSHHEC